MTLHNNICTCNVSKISHICSILKRIWVASWQNQQSGMCTQWRLRSAWASAQTDQSALSAWRKLGSLATNWAHSKKSYQTGRITRLIWVFTGSTGHFVGFVMMQLIIFIYLSLYHHPSKIVFHPFCLCLPPAPGVTPQAYQPFHELWTKQSFC